MDVCSGSSRDQHLPGFASYFQKSDPSEKWSLTIRYIVGTSLGLALTGINVRSRTTKEGRHEKGGKVFVVGYVDEKDPLNPHNWSILKRTLITLLVASTGLIVGFASSVDSAAIQQARIEFGVSEVTESLATGIYLIGFGSG
jgi:hypothetical protein